MWRASLSGATPSGLPKRTRGALPYPDSPGEAHAYVHLAATWIRGMQGINIGAVYGNPLIQSTTKMSTPFRSRSSARGDEGYFEWREAIKRRQLESERQMQAFLQETVRLREENVVLRIQASSTGPLVVSAQEARERTQGLTRNQYTLG
ncbi:hypothetical protein CK203_064068 [Vitis vinifera]|uniref:Uncharacterized protein n=1 Tax=Vitis vinifera TaxID=29760 RepID=A0A438G438_VITVI|nr:hypothetical protein CK203_064068 [Vitis vinifera]